MNEIKNLTFIRVPYSLLNNFIFISVGRKNLSSVSPGGVCARKFGCAGVLSNISYDVY